MALTFRVVDLRAGQSDSEALIEGLKSPEAAARHALGVDVVRSGARRDLVAKVYWQAQDQPVTMVRLYSKVEFRNTAMQSAHAS